MQTTQVKFLIPEPLDPSKIMGVKDELLRAIESSFEALISCRGNQITIIGANREVETIVMVFSSLVDLLQEHITPTLADVERIIQSARAGKKAQYSAESLVLTTPMGNPVRPRTDGQKRYVQALRNNTITFCAGPAGSGKTYLAVAMALAALFRKEVSRIVLTRPVVEAGESLGYLPGTLSEKLDPYVRPLYDALFEMAGADRAAALIEQNVIEIAPLAYMRGRTFNDAYVILDEAQNTSEAQMKMFLTRLGYNSKFVITGDMTQRDLSGVGGLQSARRVLGGFDDIAFVDLHKSDIVRNSLVAQIVEAYEREATQHD